MFDQQIVCDRVSKNQRIRNMFQGTEFTRSSCSICSCYFLYSKCITYQYQDVFQCFAFLIYVCAWIWKNKQWKLQKFHHVSSDSFLGDSSATWEHLYMLYRPLLPGLWEELIEEVHSYLPCRSAHRGEWGEHFASGFYSCLLTTRDSETLESWIILWALKGNLR